MTDLKQHRPMSSKQHRVNVQTFLDDHPFSPFQWLVFAMCFIVVLLDGFDTAAIGYIAPSLLGEWGIQKSALAPVLSAALFGLAAGALASGPLADRFGRRLVLTASVFVFGAASLASAWSGSLQTLVELRFVTGLGLGAAMPNAVTLISEFCPEKKRALITNAMFCGFPLGAAFGGFLAAWMIPHFGWRSVLVLGGIAPLLLGALLLWKLPESVRYLVAKRRSANHIKRVLSRVHADAQAIESIDMDESAPQAKPQSGLAVVLSKRYVTGTVMLWLAYFMGLVIFYALINWMPILFREAGLQAGTATLIAALFPLGGVGAVFFGWLMDRYNANLIIALGYLLTAATVWLIGQSAGNLGTLMVAVFVAGTVMNTAQSSMPALAAAYYPTAGRATGVSWMLGIGRFGGIAGSFLVAELSVRHLAFGEIFTVVAVPALIATVALLVKQGSSGRSGRLQPAAAH